MKIVWVYGSDRRIGYRLSFSLMRAARAKGIDVPELNVFDEGNRMDLRRLDALPELVRY